MEKRIAEADGIGIVEYYNLKKKNINKNKFKIKENNLIIQTDTTIEDIKLKYNEFEIISEVKDMVTGTSVT